MRLSAAAVSLLLVVAACGAAGQPGSAASASRVASALPSQQSLFAIATGLPGGQLVNSNPASGQATVRIVDLNGRVHATASFVPPPAPVVGNAEPLLQSPVHTAAGAVYYADSTGAVHRLKPDGSTSVVATFPLTSGQQALGYAVSPDGAHLIATVFSTPPLYNPPPQTLGDPLFQDGGHWTLKLQTADAGGSTTTTLQRDLGTAFAAPTEIVGWDKNGPLATLKTEIGAQQSPPSAHIFGTLIHLAPDGTHLDALGGPGCSAVDNLPDGTVICDQDGLQFSVRSPNGATLWQAALPSDGNYYYGLWLSPDANSVAVQGIVVTRTSVASSTRYDNYGQSQLVALGWLDASTMVVATPSGALSLYSAHGFTKLRDLGVSGLFEGVL